MTKLRNILRDKTSEAHARLDTALINYDLTTASGLCGYLQTHFLARSYFLDIQTEDQSVINHERAMADIIADLKSLGIEAPQKMRLSSRPALNPVGLTYVIAGSSLGSKILYKKWAGSTDEAVRRAGLFMTSAKDSKDWKRFLSDIDSTSFSPAEEADIVKSANACFAVYQAAVHHINRNSA